MKRAFDSVSWDYIYKVFEKFGFGENIIKWVKCFYSNIESTVMNKGYSTGWFKLGKGVRQGCPLMTVK